ncbi:cytochrome P450 [Striga asiatica]|uniref:Cytochrome P450 n=1 Tax=Striga asiatica TaxID=4170 RepID=A0A5A7P9Q1_STRAF|nr:cytochrome P450 [Striga asiatica]
MSLLFHDLPSSMISSETHFTKLISLEDGSLQPEKVASMEAGNRWLISNLLSKKMIGCVTGEEGWRDFSVRNFRERKEAGSLYKAALSNCFEVKDWGPIEWSILAKHFERRGKSPYAYHAKLFDEIRRNKKGSRQHKF